MEYCEKEILTNIYPTFIRHDFTFKKSSTGNIYLKQKEHPSKFIKLQVLEHVSQKLLKV